MDTQGSLKRIAMVFVIVAGFDFPVVSRQFIIHSDSDKSRNTWEIYGGRKEAIRAGKQHLFSDARRVFVGIILKMKRNFN